MSSVPRRARRRVARVGSWAAVTLAVSALVLSACSTAPTPSASPAAVGKTNDLAFAVVDTSQSKCYNNDAVIDCPQAGEAFSGQDAQFSENPTSYTNNGDGTVTDHVTGLMWQQAMSDKVSYADAISGASAQTIGGYSDWRVPTIKELYSLMNFNGTDISASSSGTVVPFIDSVFGFTYPDTSGGNRPINSQWVTSTEYVSTVLNNDKCFFGVNFVDGRIKCYPEAAREGSDGKDYYVRYVRNADGAKTSTYGVNAFSDQGNGTVKDAATGLTWAQKDSGKSMNWRSALAYCEALDTGGVADWRLPNAKELQSIVDYSRSPATTKSAAIDPVFSSTKITDEAGKTDWGFYWTSTTHISTVNVSDAVYIVFGRGMGYMQEYGGWIDVHGAGSQRSDPKVASASGTQASSSAQPSGESQPTGGSGGTPPSGGPGGTPPSGAPSGSQPGGGETPSNGNASQQGAQHDAIRTNNLVRCVSSGH